LVRAQAWGLGLRSEALTGGDDAVVRLKNEFAQQNPVEGPQIATGPLFLPTLESQNNSVDNTTHTFQSRSMFISTSEEGTLVLCLHYRSNLTRLL
jgi:hypothetical protein